MVTEHQQRYLAEVRRLVLRHTKPAGASVFLFGSFSRGDVHRGSDIDIAIRHDGRLTRSALATLREALEESRVPYQVDVVDMREASAQLRGRIMAEGIPWTG